MLLRSKKPISVASRMAFKLVLLSTFTLTLASAVNILPSPKAGEVRHKAAICEFLAITSSLLAQQQQEEMIQANLKASVERYPEILSACIRLEDGAILCQFGDHQRHWHLKRGVRSTRNNVYVPIKNGDQPWATVELSFDSDQGLLAALVGHPLVPLGLFTICVNGLFFRWYLRRAFHYLDPTKSVPMHVRSTLDTFSEGVVVLDKDQRIVLANDKFKRHVGKTDQELLGHGIDALPWLDDEETPAPRFQFPNASSNGIRLGLQLADERRTYLVNASAILGNDGQRKGTIASFDDITPLEKKREELSQMLSELRTSRDELSERNKELQYLATRDPLTGSLNRRTFFEIFDKHWTAAERKKHSLSCFMVDVDYFKAVNDNHGHGMGDEVLRRVAETIQKEARESDVVCRYGGEEFCMLLPETDIDNACTIAENVRHSIEQLDLGDLAVTASLGISSIALGAEDPQQLLDQADKCLYIAKRAGRNQVVRCDKIPVDVPTEDAGRSDAIGSSAASDDASVPYPAVASLLSALAYRDAATATHSIRVAELCVATASGLLSVKDTYVLEVAALLHDIGKIGVPDAILLKPGPLTRDEWETMELHDRIGVEIVEASFSNQLLVDIVRYHHATYGGSSDAPHFPRGQDIPIGARIVTIADAYDAMVSDRVYRKGRSPEEAFKELRRCAGRQFDPDLVERFILIVKDYRPPVLPVASKQTALQIGLQIERLAKAIDEQDSAGIKALAARLETTAARGGIREIEKVAADIKLAADEDHELISLLHMVDQLMTLCRSVQKVYADVPDKRPVPIDDSRRANPARLQYSPLIEITPHGCIVLTQNRNQNRQNRIELNMAQREQAADFLRKSQKGESRDVEKRLIGGDHHPDALLRITPDGAVNLTQLAGTERRADVVFDTADGMEKWAFVSDTTTFATKPAIDEPITG